MIILHFDLQPTAVQIYELFHVYFTSKILVLQGMCQEADVSF